MKGEERHLPLPLADIIVVFVSTAAVFFVLAFGGKVLEGYRLQRHNAMLRTEISRLKEDQSELEARLQYVQTPAFVERVAREQYKWVKMGEKLIITIFRRRPAVTVIPTPTPSTFTMGANESTSYWPEWWRLLQGLP